MNANTEKAPGWPSRDSDLDALPGFQSPPAGYGEVPFWWWSGEDLDVDRLLWQLRELHAKGISGVQVNYSHADSKGWPSDVKEPAIFSDDWWEIYSRISEECGQLGMGIGLSTYTLDWPWGGQNLFRELFYDKEALNAWELKLTEKRRLQTGEAVSISVGKHPVAARAYPVVNDVLQSGGVDLAPFIRKAQLEWTAPEGVWEVWLFEKVRKPGTMNALLPDSGAIIIRDFFQPFETNNPSGGSEGLNYFFNDELHVGADKFAWSDDFAAEFMRRKDYDLLDVLPGMWTDLQTLSPKVRMDYADVRMSLMEERYFKPIHDWHASRGIIFGCDSMGRGTKPQEFGDYFRVTRWYTAPGHDTPGGNADLIKGKVSSSIANLYQKPRVWLEGYHSLGWGASPERLLDATRENYLYGCTLLNLHGFYYTTYGSFWEWAPPCYHFRQPYWQHMGTFLKYFERLSYVLSQGHTVADVAIVYPVAPYEAETDGEGATATAFELGRQLMAAGISFEYIDNESLARAELSDGRLVVRDAGASYQALVLPNMDAVRGATIDTAARFAEAGGHVMVVGELPQVSDLAGHRDSRLEQLNAAAFKPEYRFSKVESTVAALKSAFVQDVQSPDAAVRALHRRAGFRDLYWLMGAEPEAVVELRAKGRVELWDPWTGDTGLLTVLDTTETTTRVQLPKQIEAGMLIVITEGQSHEDPSVVDGPVLQSLSLEGSWTVGFEPTMDNRYGDFRLPVNENNQVIGLEARRFEWARVSGELAPGSLQLKELESLSWSEQLHGFGPKFYKLGPIPNGASLALLEEKLAQFTEIDPSVPVQVGGNHYSWKLYDFSWRFGHPDDPGHQGFHGLKAKVSEDFIRLGEVADASHGTRKLQSEGEGAYFLWSTAFVDAPVEAEVLCSQASAAGINASPVLEPSALYVNGAPVANYEATLSLQQGANPILIRFDGHGQAHVVFRVKDSPRFEQRTPLAMPWYEDSGVIAYDPFSGQPTVEWLRFQSAPGTSRIRFEALSQQPVQVWADGQALLLQADGSYHLPEEATHAPEIFICVLPQPGVSGGSMIPEPVLIETNGQGELPLGDWSKMGILENYSGGVRYKTQFNLGAVVEGQPAELDLGRVIASAEVFVNGESAGVRVASPWRFDMSGLLQEGENELEVLVYNTLSNHYQTIPSSFAGQPDSGLFGPVQLKIREGNKL